MTEEACKMINSLRKVDFRTLLATIGIRKYYRPPPPAVKKILGAPLLSVIVFRVFLAFTCFMIPGSADGRQL